MLDIQAPGSSTKGLSGKSLENGPQICYIFASKLLGVDEAVVVE
jgi:hypothetical protein